MILFTGEKFKKMDEFESPFKRNNIAFQEP